MNDDSSGTERRLERVLTLFRNLGTLDVKIDFERSFKAAHGRLLEDRFLLGVNRREFEASKDDQLTLINVNIGMPRNLLASFQRHLPRANHVYFGVEKNEGRLLFKVYLEFRDEIERQIGGADVTGKSFLLFSGFKWDTLSPERQAVTNYTWHPSISVPAMLQHLQTTLQAGKLSPFVESVSRIVERAAEQIPHSQIQYLDVTEEGNPRRSFDINIYKSGLLVDDVFPCLLDTFRQFAISSASCESLYQRIKGDRIGHLAGGADRESQPFFTVYYGAKYLQSNQLRSATVAHRGQAV